MPLVSKGAQEASISCIGAELSIIKTGGLTCYKQYEDGSTNLTKVVVSRGAQELNLKDVMIRLADAAGNTYPFYVKGNNLGNTPG